MVYSEWKCGLLSKYEVSELCKVEAMNALRSNLCVWVDSLLFRPSSCVGVGIPLCSLAVFTQFFYKIRQLETGLPAWRDFLRRPEGISSPMNLRLLVSIVRTGWPVCRSNASFLTGWCCKIFKNNHSETGRRYFGKI